MQRPSPPPARKTRAFAKQKAPLVRKSQARDPRIADEVGTLLRRADRELVLCYPNSYRVAGSSLGFQVVYRALNSRPTVACHRAVLDEQTMAGRGPGVSSLEFAKPLAHYDAILVSIAYELDLVHLVHMLRLSGLAPFAADRPADAPPIIVGGPLTTSNVLPLGLFADVVVLGDGEQALPHLLDFLEQGLDRQALADAAQDLPGFWLPARHGDAVPAGLSASDSDLPALGQWHSPQAEFANMMLVETMRGCPRFCQFCVVRAPVAPVRDPTLARVLEVLDLPSFAAAPRVGFVGAAVSDWPGIKPALAAAIDRGKQIGISSLRADRLNEDDEFVDLLFRGGYRTMTVASDAPSQRMRGKMMKGLRERHLVGAAEQARRVGMRLFKMYVIVGLPQETDEDLDELCDLGQRLSTRISTAIGISPFVPKLHTPLAQAPFESVEATGGRLQRIQRAMGGRVQVRTDSPRQAWVEYRLSMGGIESGHAVLYAADHGGTFKAWGEAFAALDARDPGEERAAVTAAQRHGLWSITGNR